MSWYLILFLYLFFCDCCHVNHVQPVCTFLSRTVMLTLIFNSTAYCNAHSFILYILYFVLYILFLFILFYAYFPCVVFYNIYTVHGADLTHISLLVIHSLYSRCMWQIKLETWKLELETWNSYDPSIQHHLWNMVDSVMACSMLASSGNGFLVFYWSRDRGQKQLEEFWSV